MGLFKSGTINKGLELNLIGTSNGYVTHLNSGSDDLATHAFAAYYDTKDFFADLREPGIHQYSRLNRVDFWAKRGTSGVSSTLTVNMSTDGGSNFGNAQSITLENTWTRHTYWVDKAVMNAILRFNGSDPWEMKMYQPYVIERSMR